MTVAIGIDLGGTKTEIVALDEAGGEIVRRRRPSPRGDYDATLATKASMVREVEAELGCEATIGVGHPGAISPATGLIKNANSVWLNDRPLDRDFMARLGRQVAFANDANCLALSEATDGAGAGADIVFTVILGTGVGGGIVVGGRVLKGGNAIAGEWGHNPLPWPNDHERPGPPCYCGKQGCIETFLSGPGLSRDYAGDRRLSARSIAQRAAAGEPAADACLGRYEDRLARSLANVINIIDPEAIVLGGGLSNIARLYETVPRLWGRYVFSDLVRTRLLAPAHGDSSGARGAAWLWPAT